MILSHEHNEEVTCLGAIYIIRNTVNNRVYIGKTQRTCARRWAEHKQAINDPTKKSVIHRAMEKYGIENFYMETLEDDVPDDKLNELERFYIKEYDSFHNGYNVTLGGDGESHVDLELIIGLFDRGYSFRNIQELTGYSEKTISAHVKGARKLHKKHHAKGEQVNNGKRVAYKGRSFRSHKELAEYLKKNEPFFETTQIVSIMNYISRHLADGEFVLKNKIEQTNTPVCSKSKKRTSKRRVCTRPKKHASKSIVFQGVLYDSYKDLAIHLIENYTNFKGCKVNTVIQGISYSIKEKKTYKTYCFY